MDNIIIAWLTWLLVIIGATLVVIGGIVYLVLRHRVKADRRRAEAEGGQADEPSAETVGVDELAALELELAAASDEFDEDYGDAADLPVEFPAPVEFRASEEELLPAAEPEQDDAQLPEDAEAPAYHDAFDGAEYDDRGVTKAERSSS